MRKENLFSTLALELPCMSKDNLSSISQAAKKSCLASIKSTNQNIFRYHLAEKKVKYWDEKEKKTITPEKNTGVKFELFYFDVFEETKKIGLFETLREEEFAPLKNATGEDSPASAKEYL